MISYKEFKESKEKFVDFAIEIFEQKKDLLLPARSVACAVTNLRTLDKG